MGKILFTSTKTAVKSVLASIAGVVGKHNWPFSEPRLWILMYHRILPESAPEYQLEEPGMIVTPETFRQHLQTVRKHFTIVDLHEWIEAARKAETLPQKSIALTFDDGWADNFTYAFPILKDMEVKATIFLVSEYINTNKSFWPNRLQRILHHLGENWTADPDMKWLKELCREDYTGAPLTQNLTSRIIDHCKQLDDATIQDKLLRIEKDTGIVKDNNDLLNFAQIEEMRESGLITYGSHGATHRRLTKNTSRSITEYEIKSSKLQLKKLTNLDARLFCYPNGDINQDSIEFIKTTYEAAVTCEHGCNTRHTELTRLSRIGIHENATDSPAKLLARISGWN